MLKSLVDYWGCGKIYKKNKEVYTYRLIKFSDLTDKVLPFLKKFPIIGAKSKDFEDWCQVMELMKNKAHHTQEGLEQIRKIKAGMNTGRVFS